MPITIKDLKLYTIPETSKMLKVGAQTVRKYIKENKLSAKKIGRPLYITEDNLREFLTTDFKAIKSNTQKTKKNDINKDDEMFKEFLKEVEKIPKRYARKKK